MPQRTSANTMPCPFRRGEGGAGAVEEVAVGGCCTLGAGWLEEDVVVLSPNVEEFEFSGGRYGGG
jgi:hypothetical protein